jgi:hypothetical protein
MGLEDIPVAVGWHHIVNLELLRDFFNAQMQGVGIKLLGSHGTVDGRGQAHQAGSLVLAGVAPSVALLALAGTIGIYGMAVSMRSGIIGGRDLPR